MFLLAKIFDNVMLPKEQKFFMPAFLEYVGLDITIGVCSPVYSLFIPFSNSFLLLLPNFVSVCNTIAVN